MKEDRRPVFVLRYESAEEPHYIEWIFDKETKQAAFKAPDGATIKIRKAELVDDRRLTE